MVYNLEDKVLSEEEREKLLAEHPEFEHYIKKVRGYMCMPTGMIAIVLYKEFKKWQNDINKVANSNRAS